MTDFQPSFENFITQVIQHGTYSLKTQIIKRAGPAIAQRMNARSLNNLYFVMRVVGDSRTKIFYKLFYLATD